MQRPSEYNLCLEACSSHYEGSRNPNQREKARKHKKGMCQEHKVHTRWLPLDTLPISD